MDEKRVWVVTFGDLGSEKGQFFREEAYLTKFKAFTAALDCMKEHGAPDSFTEDHPTQKPAHVDQSWSDGYTTVWLEILAVVE